MNTFLLLVCGGTFVGSNGIIESPFYPKPYPQDKICEYLIEQPVGKAIRLSFLDMDMDPTYPLCIFNSLEVIKVLKCFILITWLDTILVI